ncbi:hypothetical protein AeMF1_002763 [Aphanomyces euteiches]|nr:hypothetical protein AeMF1_002763 [Aphanomyces euteiches]KAH9189156.1 hypothetical protein AeNC1_008864 [Aphanomyces euteiches]
MEFVLPLTLWLIFLALALAFSWRTNVLREIRTSVDDLHDIPTQALGVVVARQKKRLLGRQISDPRRTLILLSMVIELGNFSYLPLEFIFFKDTTIFAQTSGHYGIIQMCKFTFFTAILLSDLTFCGRAKSCMKKLLLPLLYDTFFTTYVYAILDIGGCANGMESVALLNCSNESNYWPVFGLATIVFTAIFWRTLLYKEHTRDQIYTVQFRFQTSYYSIMTFCRTACCLMFITVQRLHLMFNAENILLVFSVVNLVTFSSLLWYNYSHQPCLGVGMLPNNLRSLSFATACYFSLNLFLMCLIQYKSPQGLILTAILNYIFAGIYPIFAAGVWCLNARRARQFEIPNLPIKESLQHPNDRVRAVSAAALCLEDQSRWSQEYKFDLVKTLASNLNCSIQAEDGMVAAYTTRCIWMLWIQNFEAEGLATEPTEEDYLPFGLFPTSSIKATTGHNRNRKNGPPPLSALVDISMECKSHLTKSYAVLEADAKFACEQAVLSMMAVLKSPYPKARQFTPSSMVFVLCTLCGSPEGYVAKSAAKAFVDIYKSQIHRLDDCVPSDVADEFNLMHLSQFARHYTDDSSEVNGLLAIIAEAVEWVASVISKCNPALFFSDIFVANLWAIQYVPRIHLKTVFLVDIILLKVHMCCENFVTQLHRRRPSKGSTKTILSKRTNTITSAESTRGRSEMMSHVSSKNSTMSRTRATFSLERTADFLMETHSANLVRPLQYHVMRKRRDVRIAIEQHVAIIIQEGFAKKKAVVEFSESGKRALHSLACLLSKYESFHQWIDTLLDREALDYMKQLLKFVWEDSRDAFGNSLNAGLSKYDSMHSSIRRSMCESALLHPSRVRVPPHET